VPLIRPQNSRASSMAAILCAMQAPIKELDSVCCEPNLCVPAACDAAGPGVGVGLLVLVPQRSLLRSHGERRAGAELGRRGPHAAGRRRPLQRHCVLLLASGSGFADRVRVDLPLCVPMRLAARGATSVRRTVKAGPDGIAAAKMSAATLQARTTKWWWAGGYSVARRAGYRPRTKAHLWRRAPQW